MKRQIYIIICNNQEIQTNLFIYIYIYIKKIYATLLKINFH